jgi:hypothetical protein
MAVHGLFIGNNYAGTPDERPDCELDAKRMHRALGPLCKTKTLLTGADATRNGVLFAGGEIKKHLGPGDLWIVYDSGHGTFERKAGRRVEAIVLHDFELVYDFEMDALIDEGRPASSRVFAFSDTCFSGGLERGKFRRPVRSINLRKCKSHPANPPRRDRPLPGVAFVSACLSSETSFSTGHGGAATLAFLAALNKLGAGASFQKLFDLVGGPGGALPSEDYPQHPTLTGSSPDDLKRSFLSYAQPARD